MDDASKSQGKEERIYWKKKDDVECSLALCSTEKQNLWNMDMDAQNTWQVTQLSS